MRGRMRTPKALRAKITAKVAWFRGAFGMRMRLRIAFLLFSAYFSYARPNREICCAATLLTYHL